MNELGIVAFKQEISVGDEISVNTREHEYCGKVTAIAKNTFDIDEGIMEFTISYAHVWGYSKQ
ncbi:hypothetical protein D1B31_18315 [Neobacillus notoginsengisoli]|uniref:DUF2187 domain-containing protein n=1 Tax=Neobacillus notoginsengisoli TaxID=1578198 RepID=A0A417YQ86_9BACI|nr:hypothetical protein [Neobacillus notoginsengisoli]RHW36039.1 hypothetical protein D1B31_18315 [Neobacillus notoginsengisoli]